MLKKLIISIILILSIYNISNSQVVSHTAFRIQKFASAPATCNVGDVYYDTVQNQIFTCTAANTWTAGAGAGIIVGTTAIVGGTNTRILFDDNGVIGESGNFTFSKGDGAATTANVTHTGTALASSSSGTGATATDILDITGTAGQATSFSSATSRGGAGALISLIGGAGGVNSDAVNTTNGVNHRGGIGGGVTFTSGGGGNATGSTGSTGARGGDAGAINFNGGNGGTTVNNVVGGAGGSINATGGIGGISSGSAASGQGGSISYTAGTGGANSNAAGTAGSGGTVIIDAGAAGIASGGAASGTNGTVSIGTTNASAISIGNGTITTTFTGHLAVEGVTSTGSTGTGKFVFDTTPVFTTNISSPLYRSTAAKVLFQGTGAGASQLASTQTTAPTCTTNCGTGSPTVTGSDSDMLITLGTTPASAFQVNFNGTWAAAPVCTAMSALSSMVVGKQIIAIVTTQTTAVLTTNGTAPATADKYFMICRGIQ